MDGNNFNGKKDQLGSPMATSRARNRTVMLSTDMTDQVRSLINGSAPTEIPTTDCEPSKSDFVAPMMFESSFSKVDVTEKFLEKPEKMHTPSVKEILTTQEHSRSFKSGNSETGTLVHKHISSFDVEREALHRKRPQQCSARIYGFLISFDKDENGEIFDVREGRSIVSSKYSDQGSVISIDDDSISAPHAVIKASAGGQVLVLDQLSESGTSVLKNGTADEVDALGNPVELKHGDLIRFGNRYFVFCAVPKIAIQD